MSQTTTERVVQIKYRDVKIAYEVDEKTITELAEQYQVDWVDMKKAIMDYGITIRRNGEVRPNPTKHYKVVLVDTEKIKQDTTQAAVHAGL